MTDLRAYRHRGTGLIQHLSPRVGEFDALLEEVAEDAKPLAYTSIDKEAVEDYLASEADKPAKGKDEEKK